MSHRSYKGSLTLPRSDYKVGDHVNVKGVTCPSTILKIDGEAVTIREFRGLAGSGDLQVKKSDILGITDLWCK